MKFSIGSFSTCFHEIDRFPTYHFAPIGSIHMPTLFLICTFSSELADWVWKCQSFPSFDKVRTSGDQIKGARSLTKSKGIIERCKHSRGMNKHPHRWDYMCNKKETLRSPSLSLFCFRLYSVEENDANLFDRRPLPAFCLVSSNGRWDGKGKWTHSLWCVCSTSTSCVFPHCLLNIFYFFCFSSTHDSTRGISKSVQVCITFTGSSNLNRSQNMPHWQFGWMVDQDVRVRFKRRMISFGRTKKYRSELGLSSHTSFN
jgi:hypothetical protein